MKKLFLPVMLLAALMFAYAPFLILDAPFEASMGVVSKIFYFHAACGMILFVAAFYSGVGSARFLFTRNPAHDRSAVAGAELTVLFGLIVLVTGPLWARKAWGVWWVWDPRLTSTLVMWMIFTAYLLLRRYGGPGSERLAAAVSLFGMVNVPFVYWSVNFWRTLHPKTSVVPSLPPEMRGPFWYCVAAFLLLFLVLAAARVQLERRRQQLDELYLRLED
ncbi:MAG TPA: cytochrome c biogenesis protein CcsA [Vicinamibacterales bacterium]|nr:cytochrome c biogenesis protein CcsA [Vicinamibacterales bacterium]